MNAVFFIIAKDLKQPKCLLLQDWINKLWHIATMEYFSPIKKKEVALLHIKMEQSLKFILLSEKSEGQSSLYSIPPFELKINKLHTIKYV